MALSDAMLATAIVKYLEKNQEAFADFLYDLYEAHTDVDFGGEAEDLGRKVIRVTTLSSDDKPLHERLYAMQVETLDSR